MRSQPEKKSSRLCVLITPKNKEALDELCQRLDTTASQVVRRLVRLFVDTKGGVLEQAPRRRSGE